MPVARIITTSPADNEELRRQLTAAGYSVKFAAPDEEFSDADIVIAAANVHRDYALQYASEVAGEADADVIVAPGVVPGSERQASGARLQAPDTRSADEAVPTANVLFGAADVKLARSDARDGLRERVGQYGSRIGDAWHAFREKRELEAERKRLEREHREMQRAEQQRIAQQQRMEAEARIAAERERMRLQRQAEQERLRREQEEMRRAMEAERARIAAERERLAQLSAQPVTLPPAPPVAEAAPAAVPPAVGLPSPRVAVPVRREVRPAPRPAARRTSRRDQRFQRAALVGSIVALVAMIGFAVAMNVHPSSPMPHSMVQNPVVEKSPFGAASITPATSTPGPAAKPALAAPKPVAQSLPQNDASKPQAAKAKPSPSHTRRARRDNYVADDEVIIHHYGQPTAQQKRAVGTQTQAGVRRYTDQQ